MIEAVPLTKYLSLFTAWNCGKYYLSIRIKGIQASGIEDKASIR